MRQNRGQGIMYPEWTLKAWRQEVPTSTCRLVLLAIALRADEDGIARPTYSDIAGLTGLGESSIGRCVKQLLECEAMTKLPGGQWRIGDWND